jgi:mannose-6-phosphate isomerase-like protein (cupin superfamily)
MEDNKRPWGFYEVLEDMPGHKVKKIVVYPGQRLSLQRHQWRSEHWHVVRGIAIATVARDELHLEPGNSVDIPPRCSHRIANPHKEDDLVFIEIQEGTYFGEDDIERLQDDYGRLNSV